ncbi:MAG: hypothetical protein REI94_12840 [Moraxellaceae bacterium]|nr:hypothetical protein [Moraxellaceae bacterium]
MKRNSIHLPLAAWAWLAITLLLAGVSLLQWPQWKQRLDSDIFALLPHDQRDPRAEEALEQLARRGERQLVLMASSKDAQAARNAAHALREALKDQPLSEESSALDPAVLRDTLKPYRAGLLSDGDRNALNDAAEAWTARAAANAMNPVSTSGLGWNDDPYGLFGNWLLERAQASPARPVGDLLEVAEGGQTHAILNYRITGNAFSLNVQKDIDAAVSAAIAAAAKPEVTIRRAGVIMHAAATARAAEAELNLIGNGSMLGIVLVTLLTFRGWRGLPLMLLPVAVGSLWALGGSFLIFGQVHVLTLVFGASLIGVAVDYAEHALGSSLDDPQPPRQRYRTLLPGMALAWLTTVLAYAGLLVTPFPGLRQMAVFALVGITAAWLCVVLWYPFIAPASMRPGPLAAVLLRQRERYPIWPAGWRGFALAALLALPLGWGLSRLSVSDDIRGLMASNPALLAEHGEVARVLGLPSPAQFFLVSGADAETVLQREEALVAKLRDAMAAGTLGGYQALSDWLPSTARQQAAREATARLYAADSIGPLRDALGLEADWQPAARGEQALTLPTLMSSPLAPLLQSLWLPGKGDTAPASVVLLKGLSGQASIAALSALQTEGVQWVDKPARISELFSRYRQRLGWICVIAFALTVPLLWPRFRGDSWRVLAPVVFACTCTLALMGALGMPVQLLTMLALLIVLGMGVDYGVFIVDSHGDGRSFVATLLAASTTVLSFGLLAFSSTPALGAFGFAIFAGIGIAALSAPLFRRREMS